jgi:uncharacterized protein
MPTRTHRGQLTTAVADLNPWWRGSDWRSRDPDLAAARGSGLGYETPALSDLHPGGLYVLRGPRRVGKTVATKQRIDALIEGGTPALSIVRLAVDGWSARDLRTVVQNIPLPRLSESTRRWWFLDEVTGIVDDWATVIKWLRDNVTEFRDATVIVTGSSADKLTTAIGQWAGRRGDVAQRDRTLLPIGFRTFVHLLLPEPPAHVPRLPLADLHTSVADDAYRALLPWLGDLARLWDLYLMYGGFPVAVAAAKRGVPIPPGFLDDVFDVIYRDAFADSRLSRTSAMTLVARVMEGMGSPINHVKVATDAEVTSPTATRHVNYLRDGYLAWSCPQKVDGSWLALPKAQPKVYAIDPVVARLPFLRNGERPDIDPTVINEMMLGVALRRAALAAGQECGSDEFLFYHRTPSRKEIDFVSSLLGGAAIEGKFTSGSWRREAATVEASPWRGILATVDVLETDDTSAAWAVPAGILAYLVDT